MGGYSLPGHDVGLPQRLGYPVPGRAGKAKPRAVLSETRGPWTRTPVLTTLRVLSAYPTILPSDVRGEVLPLSLQGSSNEQQSGVLAQPTVARFSRMPR